MNVLITGGAGYIGSVLTGILLDHGYQVRVLDSLLFGGESLMGVCRHPNFELQIGNIRDPQKIQSALDNMDAVIHLAAIVGDPACARDPQNAVAVNLEATKLIADTAKKARVGRFVFASTCSNYGVTDTGMMACEDSPLNPVSVYAETKVAAEQYLLGLAEETFLPCICRLSTVFGISPRMRFDLLINDFTRAAMTQKKIVIYGKQFWRPYIHVQDVGRALLTCLEAPLAFIGGQTFNVGDNAQNYQKSKIAELIKEKVPDVEIEYIEKKEDPRDYRVGFDKIRGRLGYATTLSVPDGIDEVKRLLADGILRNPFDPVYQN